MSETLPHSPKNREYYAFPQQPGGHKKTGPASMPAPLLLPPSLRTGAVSMLPYFLDGAAVPLPLKYLKNSELGSTTITSPLSLNVAR